MASTGRIGVLDATNRSRFHKDAAPLDTLRHRKVETRCMIAMKETKVETTLS
jgi:hypothetical protein